MRVPVGDLRVSNIGQVATFEDESSTGEIIAVSGILAGFERGENYVTLTVNGASWEFEPSDTINILRSAELEALTVGLPEAISQMLARYMKGGR